MFLILRESLSERDRGGLVNMYGQDARRDILGRSWIQFPSDPANPPAPGAIAALPLETLFKY